MWNASYTGRKGTVHSSRGVGMTINRLSSLHFRFVVRGVAITAIFALSFWGGGVASAAVGSECEDMFFGCIQADMCGDDAGCTFGWQECEGSVKCMGGPGCPEGEVAIICQVHPE